MRNKSVFNVGINDADYVVQKFETFHDENGKKKQRRVWICPFYDRWYSMIRRCYSEVLHVNRPTYKECTVCDDWLTFSNFKAWMETQDWEGKHLDKDILIEGNKEYAPEKCVFVTQGVNAFLNDHGRVRGGSPLGVCWHKRDQVFEANCNQLNGKPKYLGRFNDPQEAHLAWKKEKCRLAIILAGKQEDERVAEALRVRFK